MLVRFFSAASKVGSAEGSSEGTAAQQSFLLGGDLTPLTGFKSRAAVAMQKARGEMDVQGCFRNDTENHR